MEIKNPFFSEYLSVVKTYIFDEDETVLKHAYELGLRSFESGQLILDAIKLQSEIINILLDETQVDKNRRNTISAASAVFANYLSPFVISLVRSRDVGKKIKPEINDEEHSNNDNCQNIKYYESLLKKYIRYDHNS